MVCLMFVKNTLTIYLKTQVRGHYKKVMQGFDRELFEALSPPVGKIDVVEFTGSKKGDRVHLKFIWPIKAEWVSRITEDGEDKKRSYFVDEGERLPPGLKYWKHEHIVEDLDGKNSAIIDRIHFRSYVYVFSLLMYPLLFLTFYSRKKQYKAYFGDSTEDL